MDSLDVVALARDLIDIDSTTGREEAAGRHLVAVLTGLGYQVVEQPVDSSRVNIVATRATPVVVLSTHYDCVPPFQPSRQRDGVVYGRGSCDAKGILAAQIAAAERLRASGNERVGLLFVVGEERGSDGARAANQIAPGSRFLVNGEPTDNRLGLATKGVLRLKLTATGRAGHSAYPERGESAIEKLIDALVVLRGLPLPEDATIGRTSYSVGLIGGGIAPNVVPPAAEAEVVFRTVGDLAPLRATLATLRRWVTIQEVLEVPPLRLEAVPGFEAAPFSFTTDMPFLDRWGTPLLLGPGSIHHAHTDDEQVPVAELRRAVDLYVDLVEALERRPTPAAPTAASLRL
jgi:acetylornithine deacetylase